jgi:hypothetical protein
MERMSATISTVKNSKKKLTEKLICHITYGDRKLGFLPVTGSKNHVSMGQFIYLFFSLLKNSLLF